MKKIDQSKFKATKSLILYQSFIKRQFGVIRDYVNETSNLIQKEKNKIKKTIETELAKAKNDDEARDIVEFHIEDFDKYAEIYTELLMNSAFVSSYSQFESSFVHICKYGQIENNKALSLKDLEGNSISNKCKKYIEKGLEINLINLNVSWEKITNYTKIRNLIIHNASNFVKDKSKNIVDQELYSYITKSSYLKQKNEKHGYFYIIDKNFTIEFCDIAEQYLLDIIELVLND